jgi:hypothetical protein
MSPFGTSPCASTTACAASNGQWVELEVVADELGKSVEAFAHIAGLQRDIDFEACVEGDHGVGIVSVP